MTLMVAPGEAITLYATFVNQQKQLIDQPDPAIRIERINPTTQQHEIVLNNTSMTEIEPGRYYYVWQTSNNLALGTVVALYFGTIEGEQARGEDVIQVDDRIEQRIVTNTAGVS